MNFKKKEFIFKDDKSCKQWWVGVLTKLNYRAFEEQMKGTEMEKIYSFTSKSFGHKETCGHKFAVMNPTLFERCLSYMFMQLCRSMKANVHIIFHLRLLRAKKKNPRQAAKMAVWFRGDVFSGKRRLRIKPWEGSFDCIAIWHLNKARSLKYSACARRLSWYWSVSVLCKSCH